MKPGTSKQSLPSESNSKTKRNAKEKRKMPAEAASTSFSHLEKSSKDIRYYAGISPERLTAMVEESSGEHLTEKVANAFVDDINYKLRFIIQDAITKARLCGRQSISSDDINDTFKCLNIEKVYGAPGQPTWNVVNNPPDLDLQCLEDPSVNLFETAELSAAYIEANEPVLTRKYLPQPVHSHLSLYYKLICHAITCTNKEMYTIALKDVRNNYFIGPIIEWFYNFSHALLNRDITYDGFTMNALEFLECLEMNPISGLTVSEKLLKSLSSLLFQRLLKANSTPSLIKPMCRVLRLICRRFTLRKLVLKKMVTKYSRLRRLFAFPMMCLANEFGVDGVMVVVLTNLEYILHVVRMSKEQAFTSEALRSYYILSSSDTYIKNICDQYYEVFHDGIIPYWKNKSYPSEQLSFEHDWHNVRIMLYKTRRKVYPQPNYKQKKICIADTFPLEEEETDTSEEAQPRPEISQKDKLRKIHPTNFVLSTNQKYFIIGKRTLLTKVLKYNARQSKCMCHTMMYHNL